MSTTRYLECRKRVFQILLTGMLVSLISLSTAVTQRGSFADNRPDPQTNLVHENPSFSHSALEIQQSEGKPPTRSAYESSPSFSETKLPNISTRHNSSTVITHTADILTTTFSPDGKLLVTGSRDTEVLIYEHATGQLITNIDAHSFATQVVKFSLDGKYLFTGGSDSDIKIWNATDWSLVHTISNHSSDVLDLDFSPDGSLFASSSYDGTACVWFMNNFSHYQTINVGTVTHAVIFDDTGERLVTGDFDSDIVIWDIETATVFKTFTDHAASITSLARFPAGEYFVAGSNDNTAKVFRFMGANAEYTLSDHTMGVVDVAVSSDEKWIFTASSDGTAIKWDERFNMNVKVFEGHTDRLEAVCVHPSDAIIATGSWDDTAIIWSSNIRSFAGELRFGLGHHDEVVHAEFSPNGTLLAESDGCLINIWNNDGSDIRGQIDTGSLTPSILDIAFSPDSKYLASAKWTGFETIVEVYDIFNYHVSQGNPACVLSFTVEDYGVFIDFDFSPDGRYIATTCHGNNSIGLWNAQTGASERLLTDPDSYAYDLDFSPDGLLTTLTYDGDVRVWNLTTDEIVDTALAMDPIELGDRWPTIEFSVSGEYILANDGVKMKVYATAGLVLQQSWDGLNIIAATISPDGQYVYTVGDYNWDPLVWETSSGRQLAAMEGGYEQPYCIATSIDGSYVVTGHGDSTDYSHYSILWFCDAILLGFHLQTNLPIETDYLPLNLICGAQLDVSWDQEAAQRVTNTTHLPIPATAGLHTLDLTIHFLNEIFYEETTIFVPYSAADYDGDDMLNDYEKSNQLDIFLDDSASDFDGDGVPNGEECAAGTFANDTDSDDDGLDDGEEILSWNSDPLVPDSDSDGLLDGDEVHTHNTNPTDRDTDNDGLTDGEEVDTYYTDPNLKDTDFDGVGDGDEIDNGTDPLVPDGTQTTSVTTVTATETVAATETVTETTTKTDGASAAESSEASAGLVMVLVATGIVGAVAIHARRKHRKQLG